MSNWNSAANGLWPEGDVVLIAIKGYVRPVNGFYEDGEWWKEGDEEPLSESGLEVTHWHPLPEMPDTTPKPALAHE